MRLLKLLAAVPAMLLLATACNPFTIIFGTGPPAGPAPGTYADFGVASYAQPELNNFIINPPDGLADYFKQSADYYHWSNVANYRNNDVTASKMVAAESSADMLFFAGHGDVGLMQLYYGETTNSPPDQTSWGPGATSNSYPSNTNGFPVQGRLKWIFAYSSMTAAPPSFLYPNNPQYTTNWLPAFGGSLHGLYGFAVRPLANGNLTPDISTGPGSKFVQAFLQRSMSVNPTEPIHSSWLNAAKDAGVGDLVGTWEDQANTGDILAADNANINYMPIGDVWYYWVQNGYSYQTYVGQPTPVGNDTYRLQPLSLSPEPLNDNTMLSNAQPYFGSPDSYSSDGSVSTAIKGGTTVIHDLRTGALSFHGIAQTNPFTYAQSDAQASATQAVQNSNGLPSDALLTRIDVNSKSDLVSGGTAIVGYTFTWRHANQPFGNDAIMVTVDDSQTRTRQCTGGYDTYYDTLGRPHQLCMGWTTYVNDTQNISYMFRMWRTQGSARSVQSLGQTSITAATAAASLPPGAQVFAYAPGYWTGAYNDPTNNVAVPAWVFTLVDGTQVYVDAYSGALLETIKQ